MKHKKKSTQNLRCFLTMALSVALSLNATISATNLPNKSLEEYEMNDDEPIIQPSFPGGMEAMEAYITKNLEYPLSLQSAGIQGQVILKFTVTKTGDIENIFIEKGLYPSCDAEAKRVVASMPKWIPGKVGGEHTSLEIALPIIFSFEKGIKKRHPKNKSIQREFTEIIYVYEGNEISANNLNLKLGELILKDKEAALSNSILYAGKDLEKRYGKKYKGKRVLEIHLPDSSKEVTDFDLSKIKDKENIVTDPDIKPSFRGGEETLNKYLSDKIRYYPSDKEAGIAGLVVLQFVVRESGRITDISVLKGIDPIRNGEIVQLIDKMPRWNAGKVNDVKVDAPYLLNIYYDAR